MGIGGRRIRRSLLVLVSSALICGAGVVDAHASAVLSTAQAQGAGPVHHTAAPVLADPESVAARQAQAIGRAVEVSGRQTATSTVYAEPDGSMRAVFTAVPTRVKQGTSWVPIDTDLKRSSDDRLSPGASNVAVIPADPPARVAPAVTAVLDQAAHGVFAGGPFNSSWPSTAAPVAGPEDPLRSQATKAASK